MEEERYMRLQEAISNGSTDGLNDFVNGSSGSIDPSNEYTYYDMEYDEFGNYAVVPLAAKMVSDYLDREDISEEFNNVTKDIQLNDAEKKMIFTWYLARLIEYKLDQKSAMNQADEYENSEEKVNYYGTKNRAYNHGYNKYMEDHVYSRDHLLEKVIEQYKIYTK